MESVKKTEDERLRPGSSGVEYLTRRDEALRFVILAQKDRIGSVARRMRVWVVVATAGADELEETLLLGLLKLCSKQQQTLRQGGMGVLSSFRRINDFREGCKEDRSKELGGYLLIESREKSRHHLS